MTSIILIVQHLKECFTIYGVIILTQIVNMEFIQTNKKSELLVFEGYGYIRHLQSTDGASSWRCCITKCNGRVRLRNEQIEALTIVPRWFWFLGLQSFLSRSKLRFLFDHCNERFERDCFVRDCFVCFLRTISSGTVLSGTFLQFRTLLSGTVLSVHR